MSSPSSIQSEIIRELRVRVLNYFTINPLPIEMWPDLFKVTVKIYFDILNKKESILPTELKVGGSMREQRFVIGSLISVLEQLCVEPSSVDSAVLPMHERTRSLIHEVLNTSAPSLLQMFYQSHFATMSPSGTSVEGGGGSPMIPTGIDTKWDDLSKAVYQNLRIKINLFTINGTNWPKLVTHAIIFLQEITPPILPSRQREIACNVLPKIIHSLTPGALGSYGGESKTISSSESKTIDESKSSLERVQAIVIPVIDSILNAEDPFVEQKGRSSKTINKASSKTIHQGVERDGCKCCIIC